MTESEYRDNNDVQEKLITNMDMMETFTGQNRSKPGKPTSYCHYRIFEIVVLLGLIWICIWNCILTVYVLQNGGTSNFPDDDIIQNIQNMQSKFSKIGTNEANIIKIQSMLSNIEKKEENNHSIQSKLSTIDTNEENIQNIQSIISKMNIDEENTKNIIFNHTIKIDKNIDNINDMKTKYIRMAEAEENIETIQSMIAKINTNEENCTIRVDENMDSRIAEAEKDIIEIKSKSEYLSVCGYKYFTSIKSAVIPYDSLLHPLTQSPGSGHTFNTGSGQFTAGLDAVYSVSWDGHTAISTGQNRVVIYLRKNGVWLQETHHASYYTGSTGELLDQGGRTVLIRLQRGDTIDLYCDNCSATLWRITFCVNLVHLVNPIHTNSTLTSIQQN